MGCGAGGVLGVVNHKQEEEAMIEQQLVEYRNDNSQSPPQMIGSAVCCSSLSPELK